MTHTCTIAGREVELAWTQTSAKEMRVRLSKIGKDMKELFQGFGNPKKAEYCVTAALWALMPYREFLKYESPELLAMVIDDETEAASVWSAVIAVIGDMSPDVEKKSTLTNSPSPESNSD